MKRGCSSERRLGQKNLKSRVFLKAGEIPVAGNQRDLVVEAGLGDEGVSDLWPQLTCHQKGAEFPCPFPVSGCEFQERDPEDRLLDQRGQRAIAQELCH